MGDVKLRTNENGSRFLEWLAERGTKTRNGGDIAGHRRQFNPVAYETTGPNCPVKFYLAFKERRPAKMMADESPFYLQSRPDRFKGEEGVWFYPRKLGKNAIGQFMVGAQNVDGVASRSGKVSNHSVRKSSISKLLDSGIDPHLVTQHSGHKRVDSLKSYHSASTGQQQLMSAALSAPAGAPQVFANIQHQPMPFGFFTAAPGSEQLVPSFNMVPAFNFPNFTFGQ